MFLPFLQGAQIAAHSSCQGNSAECPPECVCAVCRVCELPLGRNTLGLLFLWLPHSSFSSVYPQKSPSVAPSTGNTHIHTHTHVYQLTALVEFLQCVFVCVGSVSVVKMSKKHLASLCLSLLPLILTCMPTYTLHHLLCQCEHTLVRHTHFWLMETHLLLWQAAYTCSYSTGS